MGVNAGLKVVPAEEFVPREDGLVKPNLLKGGERFDLDKAWSAFDDVFRTMPHPLNCVIGGDVWPEGSLYDDSDRADATWLGFVSPPTVAAIARRLEQIETNEMIQLIVATGRPSAKDDFGRRYYGDNFEQLRKAYRAAAAEGAGLRELLC